MLYSHRFHVHAPFADVVAFHSRSASMAAITPPPILVQMHTAPLRLHEDDLLDFTLWLGPLPIRWQACIEQVTPISFVDRMVRGPFQQWIHHHTFFPITEQTTAVIDRVEVSFSPHWFWHWIGRAMWQGLPTLFAYRAWRTKQLLEQSSR